MKKSKVYALCEGAIMVALATALSYVKLMELPQGGSVCIGTVSYTHLTLPTKA